MDSLAHAVAYYPPAPLLPSSAPPTAASQTALTSTTASSFATTLHHELLQAGGAVPPAPAEQTTGHIADAESVSQVARQLESLLLYTLLKQMWATVPESNLLGTGLAGEFYREMWLEALADDVSQAGPGIGLAAILERDITRLSG